MRQKLFILTIAVAAMLTSCRRHESLLTGSYGEHVVAGQVVMASEMANSSPAGVEVSAVGTGMSAILAADGRFTFAGVPANAELAFRRADGVDARLRVSSPAPLLVELAGKTATDRGARRRGVSPKDPVPSQQIEGVIKTAGTDSIVVFDSHQQAVTVALDSSTLIRKGDKTVKAADLKVGDRVHVKALLMDNKLTALIVIVQDAEGDDENGGKNEQQVEGVIVTVSADSITVHDSHGQDVVMVINSSTIIRKGDQKVAVGDLKKDDRVHVKAAMVDGKLTALEITVQQEGQDDQHMEVEGTVSSITGTSLVVHGITVNTDSNTVIKKQGQTIAFGDIKTGDSVSAEGTRVDATTMLAKKIEVHSGGDHH